MCMYIKIRLFVYIFLNNTDLILSLISMVLISVYTF